VATVLITGAAGNLGTLLARHLVTTRAHTLRLMFHHTSLAADLAGAPNIQPVHADLSDPQTLPAAVAGADAIVHFAGVLFRPRPERFLPETNTRWFANLLRAALDAGVSRVILISFPQVEGPTSPEHPATGRLDGHPISVHARTRLEEERLLMAEARRPDFTPIVLRCGMVYASGILMIDAARWLAAHRMLAVWKQPTVFQLISSVDFARACEAAIVTPPAHGIYHVGDEQPITIQEFLDRSCEVWGCARPLRVPPWSIDAVAAACEAFAAIAGTRAWFTRDFVRLGRVPHWGDTRRAREELIRELVYPTLESGLALLR
jgi:nucleoside-diphosphate-sugar epimerase